MIRSVNPYALSFYFNPDESHSFCIPKYQRAYEWKLKQWEALFDDIQDSTTAHFLGSIICVNSQDDALAGNTLELIDGQQRFTTISLLLCAIYAQLKQFNSQDEDVIDETRALEKRIFVRGTAQWRFVPSEQMQNKVDMQEVLHSLFPRKVNAPQDLLNFGNRRIALAYKYFQARLSNLTLEQIRDFLERLKTAIVVKIEVENYSDACMLFESINNRGIALSPIDIIKNNLLAQLEKQKIYRIDDAFDKWRELVNAIPDAGIQERFLRHLYNAFKYLKLVEVRNCTRATRSNLITIYDHLLRKRPLLLFHSLIKQGQVYAALLSPALAQKKWGSSTAHALQDLQRLGAAPGFTFLLWVVQAAEDQKWDVAKTITAVATLMEKWFFWRNLTDTPPTRDLDSVMMDLIQKHISDWRTNDGLSDYEQFIKKTQTWLAQTRASEKLCDEKLAGDVYQDNTDVTRFMLCKLEESHQTKENKVNLWEQKENRQLIFTIEHILPKTENLNTSWIEMLETSNSVNNQTPDSAALIRRRCAHRLGNLTLSAYNSQLGTMDFLRKRDRTDTRDSDGKDDAIGYKNGLYLNKELSTRSNWNESAIEARTTTMTAEIKALFALPASD